MSAHFSLLFTLQQLQQLMQCLPTTILLSLSHCCLLSLIVPHFFSMLSLAASKQELLLLLLLRVLHELRL